MIAVHENPSSLKSKKLILQQIGHSLRFRIRNVISGEEYLN